jgi:hypothetical protein
MTTNTLAITITTGKGGHEFKRECEAFAAHWIEKGHNVEVVKIKKQPFGVMGSEVLTAIKAIDNKIDRFVIFCHGYWKGIQLGFNVWNIERLALELAIRVGEEIDIALYACNCGKNRWHRPWSLSPDNWLQGEVPETAGFAAKLCEALINCGKSPRVFAHATAGHTTRNPYCYMFDSGPNNNIIYRTPIINKKPRALWKQWIADLKTWRRFEIPFE